MCGRSAFNYKKRLLAPVTLKQLTESTVKDPVLSQVLRYCCDGWPSTFTSDLQPYFLKNYEIRMESGCLFSILDLLK